MTNFAITKTGSCLWLLVDGEETQGVAPLTTVAQLWSSLVGLYLFIHENELAMEGITSFVQQVFLLIPRRRSFLQCHRAPP